MHARPEVPEGATRRPITVYMPLIHAALMVGMAASFARAGILMRVSGPTMRPAQSRERRMTSADAAATFGAHVSAYEDDDVLGDPPDVVLMGQVANEAPTFRLVNRLRRLHPVVLCAYSGRMQSSFDWRRYDGVVANDVASRAIARYHGVPALKFFPNFDVDAYPFRREPEQDRVVLRSFINDFEARFPLSAGFFAECRAVLTARFGDRVVVENISRQNRSAVRRLMARSTATLHIKDSEGYGYAVLEAMATGRPLILQNALARNMAYCEWSVPDRSRFGIDRPEDLVPLVERMFADRDWRGRIQQAAADDVRRLDFQAHAERLRGFFEALMLVARARWSPVRRSDAAIAAFAPSLDPQTLQSFEAVALDGQPAQSVDWLDWLD